MRSFIALVLMAFACTAALIGVASAQAQPDALAVERKVQTVAMTPPESHSLLIDVGVGSFFSPAFAGSNEYQLIAAPMISLRYKDRVFFSVQQGLGVELIQTDNFKAGPVISFQGPRRESNSNPFRMGGRSDALRGLGNVDASPGVGGFAEYRFNRVSARIDVRKQVSGSNGLTGTIGLRYTQIVPRAAGRPIVFSIGPRATFVDANHNNAYYGVTAGQSLLSGLPLYEAKGGLLSAGLGVTAVVPLSGPLSSFLFAGYDRLAGDAARSPLVEERGSRDQPSVGLGIEASYTRVFQESNFSVANGSNATRTVKDHLLGVSPSSYSLVGFYEKGLISGRIGYAWREAYLQSNGGVGQADTYFSSFGSLDGNISVAVNPRTSVTLSGVNLLRSSLSQYGFTATGIKVPGESYAYGRTVSLGAQIKF